MRRINKFLRLSSVEQRLLVKSVFLLGGIRLGLWLLPFRIIHGLLARVAQMPNESSGTDRLSAERIAWAVTVAKGYVPAATCLTQALAAEVLLRRKGYPAHLCIGVAKDRSGKLKAHAWVESQGMIVIGGREEQTLRFTPLLPLERETP